MRQRLKALPAGWKVVLTCLAVIVAMNAIAAIGNRIAPEPTGPAFSSYSTTPDGAAALAELLERDGRDVERLRGELADASLDPGATVFLLGPDRLTSDDQDELRSFLEAGGRLVAGGPRPYWLRGAVDGLPDWSSDGSDLLRPLVPAPELGSVAGVTADGYGGWEREGSALPILGGEEGPALVTQSVGEGEALALADVSPLQNAGLDEGDNAALALGLAGERGRKVIFVEGVHGFGESRGLAALPDEWKWALAGLGLAGLVAVWALGKRFGPPEDERRPLPPPRRGFVDAQALTLARTKRPSESAEPVRAAARDRLARRAALRHGATEAELRRAAEYYGLPPEEAEAVFGESSDVMAAGRALARLEGGRT